MTEFEEIDGKLVMVCDHKFTNWEPIFDPRDKISSRYCKKCGTSQYLKPMSLPRELPIRSKFSVFLADFKVKRSK